MRPVIWFSRHVPTEAQAVEIRMAGYGTIIQNNLGSQAINSEDDLKQVVQELADLVKKNEAKAIFGVCPVPLKGAMYPPQEHRGCVPFFEAWNVSRTEEGLLRPTFTHYKWVKTGAFPVW